jgi:hypothetical protein
MLDRSIFFRSAPHLPLSASNQAAILLKFCALAAIRNLSRAPLRPRSLKRSSRRMRFKCANSISTFVRCFVTSRTVLSSRSSVRDRALTHEPGGRSFALGVWATSGFQWTVSGADRRKPSALRGRRRNIVARQARPYGSFQAKSLLENVPSDLSLLSQTGTCGSICFSSTIQPSISEVP